MGAYSCKSSANSNYILLNEQLNALCHDLKEKWLEDCIVYPVTQF